MNNDEYTFGKIIGYNKVWLLTISSLKKKSSIHYIRISEVIVIFVLSIGRKKNFGHNNRIIQEDT